MKTFKKLTVVYVLMFGITTSAFASWWNPFTWSIFKKKETQKEQQIVTDIVSVATITKEVKNIDATEDWKVYSNPEYGFEVKFPKSWQDYKIKTEKNKSGVTYVRFDFPYSFNGISRYYDSALVIAVYPKEIWEKESKETTFSFIKIKEEGAHLFGYMKGHDMGGNKELEKASQDIPNIINTFKIIGAVTAKVDINENDKGWSTYTDFNGRYSVGYPNDAQIIKNNQACIIIYTKEFGSVYINVGSSDPCGVPTGIADGRHMKDSPLIIEDKEYVFSGYKQNDNSFSFFSNELNKKISIVYGVEHFDKSNPKSWKGLGSLDASEYQSAINSAKEIVSTFKNIGGLNEKGNTGWNKYVNVNRKFAMLYPDDLIAREIYSKDLIVCFESKEKPFKLCVSDTVSELAANDSEVFRDLRLSELESKLNTKISANNSKYDGKYFIYLNNIVIYSEDKDLLQKMLQTLIILGENEGIHK